MGIVRVDMEGSVEVCVLWRGLVAAIVMIDLFNAQLGCRVGL